MSRGRSCRRLTARAMSLTEIQIFWLDFRAIAEHPGIQQHVLELPHVTWPTVLAEFPQRAAREALRMNTQDPMFFFHAGMIERALGNEEAARSYLETALAIDPGFHHVMADEAREVLEQL